MKLFLHMDDTGFLSDWVVDNKKELRDKANELIENSEPGSWLIRTCSIKDSDCFKARVISFKNLSGELGLFAIGYLYSYGYMNLTVKREFELPSLDNKSQLPAHVKVYPSFIDCLNDISILKQFTLSKIIRNQNNQHNEAIPLINVAGAAAEP